MLGNCWFLAAASSLAEQPQRMEKVFLNNKADLNDAGIYGVNLYSLGVPHTVIVDDYVPHFEWNGKTMSPFSKISRDNAMWMQILEKAFAKYHGNYAHIDAGNPPTAVRIINGSPNIKIANIGREDPNKLWAKLMKHDAAGDIMNAGTWGNDDSHTDANGLMQGHAFTLLGVTQLDDGTRIVKLRNPHGTDHYKGPWSDDDPRWNNPSVAAQAGFRKNKNDGIIHMDLATFMQGFKFMDIGVDINDWHLNYMMEHDADRWYPGTSKYCGKTCAKQQVKFTSDVAQTVHITAHTWHKRNAPAACDW